MPTKGDYPQRVTVLWIMFAALGLAAFVLGYLGLAILARHRPDTHLDRFDLAYNDLQLYVLGADLLQGGGRVPWQLQFARFAAPLFTVGAVVEAGRLLLASELRRFRARRARRHIVVCGDTAFADELAAQLFEGGGRVVRVTPGVLGPLDLTHRRMLGVAGEQSSPDVLREAGLPHARVVYICGADDDHNQAAAVAASRVLQRHPRPPWIYVQVHDAELTLALQARRLGAAGSNRLRLDYFHLDDLAARAMYRHHPLPELGDPPRLMIAGDAPFRRFLLVETARYWQRRRAATGCGPLPVELVSPDATAELAAVRRRFPVIDAACAVRAEPRAVEDLVGAGISPGRYERVYLCLRDESRALALALHAPVLWHAAADALVVPLHGRGGLAGAFHGEQSNDLLDELNGKLRLYPIAARACDAKLIAEDLTERLARGLHQAYLEIGHDGTAGTGSPGAMRAWEELPETLRAANRAQVQDFATRLLVMDCVVAPRTHPGIEPIQEQHVEMLSQMEHHRWCREREHDGWRIGPRDDARRRHPDLRPWHSLPADSQERNRQMIRRMPAILADAGLEIVGLPARQRTRRS